MEHAEIEAILLAALNSLYAEELKTIQIDVGERMICGQLRGILQPYFPDHSVHAEYNRHGLDRLCCTNQLMVEFPLALDRVIPQLP
ncbi:hypothetical protein [Candidatus Oleimmundimicrobium sp.]|uniref:hypothetical protein n=1 Tax=Candidatus Oleimmundimicrobium sp. TaxID=3060597 RepID=UPI0027233066|nr:hypothetical protein [Candidatus Oleimmundimicrobium sp.]MDO8886198.1 hypothetical protein [Candidatus Oleimmundimicrobium sp.]